MIAGVVNATVSFKLKNISKRKFIFRTTFWIIIFVGILFAESIYQYLFSNNLTQTEPLSLFDVIQITAIVFILFILGRANSRINALEKKVKDFHQELSIKMSE